MKSVVSKKVRDYAQIQNPLAFISDAIDLYKEIIKEITEQKRIAAETEVKLAEIAAKREVFLEYLRLSFQEREENFRRLFEIADTAMENRDTEALAVSLNSINELAKSTPFKDLIHAKKFLQGNGNVVDI
jgi:AcrR family transcriptional regulator